jgi:hypothetical protein
MVVRRERDEPKPARGGAADNARTGRPVPVEARGLPLGGGRVARRSLEALWETDRPEEEIESEYDERLTALGL